jgi:CheY-like chemotaxis protein
MDLISGNDIIESMDKEPRERRKHERIPFREDIIVDGVMKATSVDICEVGLYVCAKQPYDENTVIDVAIPFKGEMFTLKAQVHYSQLGIGMGVKFIDLNDEQRRKLKELIDNIAIKSPKPGKNKILLVLVEDDDISQQYKEKLLVEGFSVIQAKDVIEAMKILREQPPDLIILDLYMKKMDGFKALSILKTNPRWKELPVIVCSTSETEDVMKQIVDAGADEFLDKMITPASQLVDVVRTVLWRGR